MEYRNIVNKSNLQDPTAFPMDTNKPGDYEIDDSVSFKRGPSKNGRLWIFPMMVSIGWADQPRKKKNEVGDLQHSSWDETKPRQPPFCWVVARRLAHKPL